VGLSLGPHDVVLEAVRPQRAASFFSSNQQASFRVWATWSWK
jgi:hypothetical protein